MFVFLEGGGGAEEFQADIIVTSTSYSVKELIRR